MTAIYALNWSPNILSDEQQRDVVVHWLGTAELDEIDWLLTSVLNLWEPACLKSLHSLTALLHTDN